MPTGYTASIKDGVSFKEFASQCARAFGALVELRDEPLSSKLPDEIKVSDYYLRQIRDTTAELEALENIPLKDAEEKAQTEYKAAIAHNKEYAESKKDLKKKYNAMLKDACAWTPPSKDHQGLKDFMIEQLKESIRVDCSDYAPNEPILLTGEQWLYKKQQSLKKSLNYHIAEYGKEQTRTAERNEWIRQLKESLE
jgi:hypothetical protein